MRCNLIARRQASAGEAVDADDRARAGDLLEHPLQFVGVVGQLIDLGLAQGLRQTAGLFLRRRHADVGFDVRERHRDRDLLRWPRAGIVTSFSMVAKPGADTISFDSSELGRAKQLDEREPLVVGRELRRARPSPTRR